MGMTDMTQQGTESNPVRLHVGGTKAIPGWMILNIEPGPDVDVVADCRFLNMFADGSVAEVYVSHVLEHLSHQDEFQQALNEISRVLKVGGILRASVPDLAVLFEIFQSSQNNISNKWGVVNILFGGQSGPFDFHKAAFDEDLLRHFLRQSGFDKIQRVDNFGLLDDASSFSYAGRAVSLNMQAQKTREVSKTAPPVKTATVATSGSHGKIMGPVYSIPQEYLAHYCMQGRVPIFMHFLYETSGGVLQWTKKYWDSLAPKIAQLVNSEVASIGYSSDVHLVTLFRRHPIADKTVVVIGSVHPLYEAMAAHFGGIPSTVEYRRIEHDIPGLKTYTVDEFSTAGQLFDCAVSISSIEHDGLGRYGDPIDPDGDLATMRSYKSFIRKGGLLFLSVPVGQDAVCWNAHRIYGRHRLPKLLEGWRLVDHSGFDDALFDSGIAGTDFSEPVFVLENI